MIFTRDWRVIDAPAVTAAVLHTLLRACSGCQAGKLPVEWALGANAEWPGNVADTALDYCRNETLPIRQRHAKLCLNDYSQIATGHSHESSSQLASESSAGMQRPPSLAHGPSRAKQRDFAPVPNTSTFNCQLS